VPGVRGGGTGQAAHIEGAPLVYHVGAPNGWCPSSPLAVVDPESGIRRVDARSSKSPAYVPSSTGRLHAAN